MTTASVGKSRQVLDDKQWAILEYRAPDLGDCQGRLSRAS